MKKLLLILLASACFAQSPISNNPLGYMTVTVPVTTTRQSLYTLIGTYMAASRPNDYLNYSDSCSWVQYTGAKANTGSVLSGDATVANGTAPTRQAGAELAAGEGVYETSNLRGDKVNLKGIWVISDTGTQYLNIRIRY